MAISLEQLFKDNYRKLSLFALQLIKDEEIAKDVVQEVFLYLLNNQIQIPKSKTQSFLYSCVKNACLNKLRRNRIEINYLNAQDPEPEDDVVIINNMIKSEVLTEILSIVESLPAGCKQVFKMGYLEGIKNPKIAEELNISINTVKSQKKRGLELIKLKLNPEHFLILSAFIIK